MVADLTISQEVNMIPNTGTMPIPQEGDPQSVKAYVTWWLDNIKNTERYRSKRFKRMDECSRFARGEMWEGQKDECDQYTVNLIQSEIQASVAALYAKDPTFVAKRKPRLDFKIWDENPKTFEEAMMAATQLGDPAAVALIADVQEGKIKRMKIDRIARTLEIVMGQQILQQKPGFKQEMKQLIRRVETHGVGFLKLDFQRLGELRPEEQTRVADFASRMAGLEAATVAEEGEEGYGDSDRKVEERRIAAQTLMEQPVVITQEGLVCHFPRTAALIIDRACSQIRGFVGARWVAEKFLLPACTIKLIYGVDVRGKASPYAHGRVDNNTGWDIVRKSDNNNQSYDDLFCVYEVYNKDTGSVMTLCEGFDGYLRKPAAPRLILERFFPYYSLSFNEIEDASDIYPPSTVELLKDAQREINRSQEALRQHRIANKPHYAAMSGSLSSEELKSLEAAPAHAIVLLNSGSSGALDVNSLFQQIKKHPIDPAAYDISGPLDHIRRITRRSDAMIGGRSNASATADSIAADSRQAEDKSKSDDIDEFLTEFARDAGVALMMNMSKDQVVRIAGPGAMWPEMNPADLIQDISLEIQAGSSGRPNLALEVSTFQRLFPILVQTPGINPTWLAKEAIKKSDATVDLTEAYLEGIPSIQAMNAMAMKMATPQTGTGNPETEPTAQGAQGLDKNPRPAPADNALTVSQGMNEIPETATENSILQ